MSNPDAEVGAGIIGGSHMGRANTAKAGIRVDANQLETLKRGLTAVKAVTMELRKEMDLLAAASKNVADNVGNMQGGSAKGYGASLLPKNTSQTAPTKPSASAEAAAAYVGGAGGAGGGRAAGFANFFAAGGIGAALTSFLGQGMRAMDSRIDRGMAYSSSADRLNLLTQQMQGLSQMQVMQGIRQPMQQFRLGTGGINAIQQFQAQTGYMNVTGLGGAVEALRTQSGFSLSTQDVLSTYEQMLNPAVANRMLMTIGVNAFEIGGGMRDPQSVNRDIIRRLGLDNAFLARNALRPGSVARAQLADIGITGDAATQLIQQGQQQIQFRERGGEGFYNAQNAQHRQIMGIEGNFATQQEETNRVQVAREENFMRRQIDNMAALEESNQKLIEALGSLEDKMSGLFGAAIESRPARRIGGAIGGGLTALGLGAMMIPVPGARVFGAAAIAAGALTTAMSGDPERPEAESMGGAAAPAASSGPSSDANIKVPYGYNGQRISLAELKNKSNFQQLHPKFQNRLLSMMRANPNVGLGGGYRSPEEQERMFLSRYRPTMTETGTFWRGTNWERHSGAPAAPPGRSMHEIGLAADLVGDLDWVVAHGGKFGLKDFSGVNGEPWHVQPSDLPNSRSKYEKQGAPWGSDNNYSYDDATQAEEHSGMEGAVSGYAGGLMTANMLSGMSISEIIAFTQSRAASVRSTRMNSVGGGSWSNPQNKSPFFFRTDQVKPLGDVDPRALLAAKAAYKAGFRGQDLIDIVAIAGRESRWDPTAKNPNTSDRGMWQINWSANKEIALQVPGIDEASDLFDPYLNAEVARRLFLSSRDTSSGEDPGFMPWRGSDSSPYLDGASGWDRNGDHRWHTDSFREAATAAAASVEYSSGDPVFSEPSHRVGSRSSGSKSTTNHFTSSPTINVAPIINFNGTADSPDLRNIAKTVSRYLKEEVDAIGLRSA